MTNEKSPSKMMAILAFCTAILACIGFFLPMAKVYFVEVNGMDLMDTESMQGIAMIVGLVAAGAAVLFGLLALGNRKMLSTTATCAVIAFSAVLFAFISGEVMEYATTGFWMLVVGDAACAAVSFGGLKQSKAE